MKTTKLLTVMILALCIVLALSACDLNITGDINGTLNDSTSTKDPENAPVQDPTEDDKTKDEPTKDNQTKDEPVYDDELCEDGKEHIDRNEDNFCDKCGKEAFAYTQPEHPNFDNNASDPGMSEHEHCDNDGDAICDRCGKDLDDYNGETDHEHYDEDGDGYCDADNELLDPTVECECNCHKDGITNFFFKLILFFQRLFGSNKECSCGVIHY